MTSKDVRDIMDLPAAAVAAGPSMSQGLAKAGSSSGNRPPGFDKPKKRRLDGVTRELYALMGDNAPSIALAQAAKPKFKERMKRSGKRGSKWRMIEFENASRSNYGQPDSKEREASEKLRLRHWVRDPLPEQTDGYKDNKFAKFDTNSGPYSYSNDEYDSLLKEDGWTKEDTDHLFQLAKEYDLRFIVMQDRWQGSTERSTEDLKGRYYSCCRKLVRARPSPDEQARAAALQSLSFDKDREVERKSYLKSLLSRTPEQIAEEDFLYIESRRLEQCYNRITAERAELLRILGGREGIGATGGVQVGVGGGVKGKEDKTKKKQGWELEGPATLPDGWAGEGSKRKATPAEDAANGIERHPLPSANAPRSTLPSVCFRSSRIQQPKQALLPRVNAALAEIGMSQTLIMPTKPNIAKMEGLLATLAQLTELKRTIDKSEAELRMWKKRKAMAENPELKDEEADAAMRSKRSVSASSSAAGSHKRQRRD